MATVTSNLGLTLPFQTEAVSVTTQNDNMNIIDGAVGGVEDALAIVANGNTHAAIASGQYVYVRNHTSLAQGLYKATAAIAANATLSTSNLTADGSGGLNDLKASVDTLNGNLAPTACTVNLASLVTSGESSILVIKAGHIVKGIFINLKVSSAITTDTVVATIQNAAPTNQVFFNGKTINGADVFGFVKTDGTISISGITGLAANTNVYGTFMYVTSA